MTEVPTTSESGAKDLYENAPIAGMQAAQQQLWLSSIQGDIGRSVLQVVKTFLLPLPACLFAGAKFMYHVPRLKPNALRWQCTSGGTGEASQAVTSPCSVPATDLLSGCLALVLVCLSRYRGGCRANQESWDGYQRRRELVYQV